MSGNSKELFEHLVEVIGQLPEKAAVDALSHATARAEGLQAGLELAAQLRAPDGTDPQDDGPEEKIA